MNEWIITIRYIILKALRILKLEQVQLHKSQCLVVRSPRCMGKHTKHVQNPCENLRTTIYTCGHSTESMAYCHTDICGFRVHWCLLCLCVFVAWFYKYDCHWTFLPFSLTWEQEKIPETQFSMVKTEVRWIDPFFIIQTVQRMLRMVPVRFSGCSGMLRGQTFLKGWFPFNSPPRAPEASPPSLCAPCNVRPISPSTRGCTPPTLGHQGAWWSCVLRFKLCVIQIVHGYES